MIEKFLEILKSLGPGQIAMYLGGLLIMLGVVSDIFGFQVIPGQEDKALYVGVFLFIVGAAMSFYRYVKEGKL